MTGKPILDIPINDEKFKSFLKIFEKYQEALKKQPAAWGAVDKATETTKTKLGKLAAGLAAEASKAEAAKTKEVEKQAKAAKDFATSMKSAAGASITVAKNLASATASLLKWTGVATVLTALAGAGGLWGLDRMALSIGGQRRQALGTGTTTGQQSAFRINYGRYVDSDSFLSNVNSAIHDPSKQWSLLANGISQKEIQEGNTADIASKLLPNLRRQFMRNGQTTFGMQAFGLDNYGSLEDFTRLARTSDDDLAKSGSDYNRDAKGLGVDPAVQKDWLEFSTQLSRASVQVENVFIKGLRDLAPELKDLSASVVKAVEIFADNPNLKNWIKDLGAGLKSISEYMNTNEFKDNIVSAATAIGRFGHAVANIVRWIGDHFGGGDNSGGSGPAPTEAPAGPDDRGSNNPGNIRDPKHGGFMKYRTPQEGVLASGNLLRRYYNRDHLDNIRDIVTKWAPPSENDTEAYIADVVKRTGYKENQKLDLNDMTQLGTLESAMLRHEGTRGMPASVVITILNNTGGSASVTTNQVAQ